MWNLWCSRGSEIFILLTLVIANGEKGVNEVLDRIVVFSRVVEDDDHIKACLQIAELGKLVNIFDSSDAYFFLFGVTDVCQSRVYRVIRTGFDFDKDKSILCPGDDVNLACSPAEVIG